MQHSSPYARPHTRRAILGACAATLMVPAVAVSADKSAPAAQARITAVAFDAFPVFDPTSVNVLAETLFPGQGAALMQTWRARQFEYTWLRALSQRYADFLQVTDEALVFAAGTLKLDLTVDKRRQLVEAHLALKAWPDAKDALLQLKARGVALAFLSNFTPAMLAGCITASGLDGIFDHVVSTDAARTYKPDPHAYQLGVDALRRPRGEILFAAFAGWDAAGAKSFGYPTYWVNRSHAPPEGLGVTPDGVGATLDDLVHFLAAR